MSFYELLISRYPFLNIKEERQMPVGLSGLYLDNQIFINKNLPAYEKTGVLGEELGHYETTYGDIVDLNTIQKKKLEEIARRWGYETVLSFERLIECFESGHRTIEEVCLHLEITPLYLQHGLEYYKAKYGLSKIHNNYEIYFEPLNLKCYVKK